MLPQRYYHYLQFLTHPDDESSKGAATIARYAAAGVRCVLVTATGGEAGDILNPAMDRQEVRDNLAAYRHKELHTAAQIIGYHEVVELGYRDSGMPDTPPNEHPDAFVNQPHDDVLRHMVRVVRKHRPTVMMGYDAHERYPHPDHLLVHRLSLDVFDAAADPDQYPNEGEPWEVSRLVAPVFGVKRILALHHAALERGYESQFARWIDEIDPQADDDKELIHIPVHDTIGVGREALKAHATQIDPTGRWFSMPIEVVAEVYPFDDYEALRMRSPLPADATDLFVGL